MTYIIQSSSENARDAVEKLPAADQNPRMNLARIRAARGLSQRDLAEMIGVDQSTIQRAEREHSSAKLATYKRCAEVLGVTVADIFSDNRRGIEMALLRQFREIPEDRQDRVLALLDLIQATTHPSGNSRTD